MTKEYTFSTDYTPAEYDEATVVACGAAIAEILGALEQNALRMLASIDVQHALPSKEAYEEGKLYSNGKVGSVREYRERAVFAELAGEKPDEKELVDLLAVTTTWMIGDAAFLLQFVPTKRYFMGIKSAINIGLDTLKMWEHTDWKLASLHQDGLAWVEKNVPTMKWCDEIIEDAQKSPVEPEYRLAQLLRGLMGHDQGLDL